VDRNSLVPPLEATGADKVRADWNERLLTKVAPPIYARLLEALAGIHVCVMCSCYMKKKK
jgi:hypothetical protein